MVDDDLSWQFQNVLSKESTSIAKAKKFALWSFMNDPLSDYSASFSCYFPADSFSCYFPDDECNFNFLSFFNKQKKSGNIM